MACPRTTSAASSSQVLFLDSWSPLSNELLPELALQVHPAFVHRCSLRPLLPPSMTRKRMCAGDYRLKPDPKSLRQCSWHPSHALAFCSLDVPDTGALNLLVAVMASISQASESRGLDATLACAASPRPPVWSSCTGFVTDAASKRAITQSSQQQRRQHTGAKQLDSDSQSCAQMSPGRCARAATCAGCARQHWQ